MIKNNRATALVICCLLVLVLGIVGGNVIMRSTNESKLAQRFYSTSQAFWIAEAGVHRAINDINNNSCTGFVRTGTQTACTSCTNCGTGTKTLSGSITGAGEFGVLLDAANTNIQVTGSYPSSTATGRLQRSIRVNISNGSLFGYGIYAKGLVNLDNNVLVDSYNSTSSTNSGNYGNGNVASNGSVGSAGTTAGIVNVDNNVDVHGNVSTGSGGTVTVDNNADITGTISSGNTTTPSSVTVPSALTGLSAGTSYSLGNNATGSLGAQPNYRYDTMNLSNGATLNITSNVSIYLTNASSLTTGNNAIININNGASLTIYAAGVVDVSNNVDINTASQKPKDFVIYSTYTGTTGVIFGNNGDVFAAVYAPDTKVDVSNNVNFYGAVVGKSVNVDNNVNFHYDEALANLFASASFSWSNWQEM